ncbi:hypothetical protein JTT01_22065 [Clostridium botulinum]|nr:hypothetical protein [Clostridium botulinum]MCS4465455.1 hypothetical protein [Clostridium botulinum]
MRFILYKKLFIRTQTKIDDKTLTIIFPVILGIKVEVKISVPDFLY